MVFHPVLIGRSGQHVNKMRIFQMQAGEIHPDGHHGLALFLPCFEQAQGFLQHKFIQFQHEAVFLKNRDKLVRRNEPLHGMLPAHQRFGAAGQARFKITFGLQINFKFPVAQSLVHTAFNALFGNDLAAGLLIIKGTDLPRMLFGRSPGQIGAVHHNVKRHVLVHQINAAG